MHKKKDPEFGGRLKYLRKKAGLTQVEIAGSISVSPGSYQRYEYGFSPSRKNIDKIVELFRCSKIWLIHGRGEPYPMDGEFPRYSFISGKTGIGHEQPADPDRPGGKPDAPTYNKVEAPPDDDPRIVDLLTMTKETLVSGTGYSDSLAVSIRSFYNAAKTERRLNEIEGEMAALKNQVAGLVEFAERCCRGNDGRIRDYDPPEKKEELIKMRGSA